MVSQCTFKTKNQTQMDNRPYCCKIMTLIILVARSECQEDQILYNLRQQVPLLEDHNEESRVMVRLYFKNFK